jgi:hypothetical protein
MSQLDIGTHETRPRPTSTCHCLADGLQSSLSASIGHPSHPHRRQITGFINNHRSTPSMTSNVPFQRTSTSEQQLIALGHRFNHPTTAPIANANDESDLECPTRTCVDVDDRRRLSTQFNFRLDRRDRKRCFHFRQAAHRHCRVQQHSHVERTRP